MCYNLYELDHDDPFFDVCANILTKSIELYPHSMNKVTYQLKTDNGFSKYFLSNKGALSHKIHEWDPDQHITKGYN